MRFPKCFSHPKDRTHRRKQLRLFWSSFFISSIFILCVAAFLYVANGQQSGIHEPVLSVVIPSQQSIYENGKQRPQIEDAVSLSFFGLKTEISLSELQSVYGEISRLYDRYGIFIPAKYRATAGILSLLRKLL